MIYVHIPFCARKCNYCAFNSKVSDAAEIAAYVDALISEIKSIPYSLYPLNPQNKNFKLIFEYDFPDGKGHGKIFLPVKK